MPGILSGSATIEGHVKYQKRDSGGWKITRAIDVSSLGGHTTMAKATFGAGCFWGVEHAFRQMDGVTDALAGYAGGTTENPSYAEVCAHGTGHAEVVRVEYDPARVTYEQLLGAFWELHDPTQLNRQGPDVGDQYRSVIFFHTPEQETVANASKANLEASGVHNRPIVTTIESAPQFWRAEESHQRYLERHGRGTCRLS